MARLHPTIHPTGGVSVRVSGLVASCLIAATLAACTDANTSPGVRGDDNIRRRIWTDPATGCQFHFWETGMAQTYAMALSPRIGPDRLPVCGTGRNG